MWIIGYNFIKDLEFTMPVIARVVGVRHLEDLIMSLEEVTDVSIRRMILWVGFLIGLSRAQESLLFSNIF